MIKSKPMLLILTSLILVALHLYIRFPSLTLAYFHNEDSAGITYSADLILKGGLPLIDTVDMKAPGSFFLLASWWSLVGRSIENAQLLAVIWSALAAIGMGLGAWLLYRSCYSALLASALYIYLAPFTDSIDINYGAWMITPYIWGASFLWLILRNSVDSAGQDESILKQHKIWFFTGLLIAAAALMKRQGSALFPLALFVLFHFKKERVKLLFLLSFGVVAGFASFFAYYTWHGHGLEAMQHYFFSRSGWDYLSSSLKLSEPMLHSMAEAPSYPKWPRLWDGIYGLPYHLPVSFTGAVFVQIILGLKAIFKPKDDPEQARFSFINKGLGLFFFLSFCGSALGLRFFKGYYLQVLPALIWMMVQPRAWQYFFQMGLGLLNRSTWQSKTSRSLIWLLLIISLSFAFPSAIQSSWSHLTRARQMRSGPLYLPTVQIKQMSEFINKQERAKSLKTTTLWVWGRWAWPAYFYTQAQCPTQYFKNLGVLTNQLNNTWNPARKSENTKFSLSSPWPKAITQLKAQPPSWIIISKNESTHGFKELHQFLNKNYVLLSYSEIGIRVSKKNELFKLFKLKA